MGTPVPATDLPDNIKYVPPEDLPPTSVMNPNDPSVLKRIGNFAANPQKTVPLAAGLATAALPVVAPEASLPVKLGLAAFGGFASPYASAAASKAMGGTPETPSVWDALTSMGMNMAFEGMSVKAPKAVAGAQALQQLPKEEQTIGQLTQQMRNTDFLKTHGFNDAQIAEIAKDPEGAAIRLKQSLDEGNRVGNVVKQTFDGERQRLQGRFDAGYGEQKTAAAPINDVGQSMIQVAQQSGQHELTPSFQSWLERKGKQLSGTVDTSTVAPRAGTTRQIVAGPRGPAATVSNVPTFAEQIAAQTGQKSGAMSVEQMAELRTELRENVPANPTPLDKKAAAAFEAQITAKWEDTLRKAGVSEERIGQLKGTYEEWGRFQKTLAKLTPSSKEFGEQTADAFFEHAAQNPTMALNFVRMAEEGGQLPQFREAFLHKMASEMVGESGGPINQMAALQKIQTLWRDTKDGKAVLTSVFGKDSPLANPVELSKFLGSANSPATRDALAQTGRQMSRTGFVARNILTIGMLGGGIYKLRNDPDMLPKSLMLIGSLAAAGAILPRLSSGGQRAMINMLATPNPETVQRFFKIAGPALTAGFSQPSDLATETPRP